MKCNHVMTRSLDRLTAVFLPSCAKSDDEMVMDFSRTEQVCCDSETVNNVSEQCPVDQNPAEHVS